MSEKRKRVYTVHVRVDTPERRTEFTRRDSTDVPSEGVREVEKQICNRRVTPKKTDRF